jgi:hypothetical protein
MHECVRHILVMTMLLGKRNHQYTQTISTLILVYTKTGGLNNLS